MPEPSIAFASSSSAWMSRSSEKGVVDVGVVLAVGDDCVGTVWDPWGLGVGGKLCLQFCNLTVELVDGETKGLL